MYFNFGNVLVFLVLGLALAGMMLGLGRLLRPANPLERKLATYECGELPTGGAWINFNIRFYLIALIFLIFDVELAFMYPVVVVYRDAVLAGHGPAAFAKVLIFVGILAVGLVCVWAKGDFEWVKRVPAEPESDGREAV